MKRNNMWQRSEDRVRARRSFERPAPPVARYRQRSRSVDPWGRRISSRRRQDYDDGPSGRYDELPSHFDDHPSRYYDDVPTAVNWDGPLRNPEEFYGYGGSWPRSRRERREERVYSGSGRLLRERERDYIDRRPRSGSYDDGPPAPYPRRSERLARSRYPPSIRGDYSYGGGFGEYPADDGYGGFASRRDGPRHLDEPPGLAREEKVKPKGLLNEGLSKKVIDRIDEAGICWDFNSDWGCRRLGCRLRHELVESAYPTIGEQPQESSEEKSKRDNEMLQYFQKIDQVVQVTQNQKKAQAPSAPPVPPEINPQHSTILDEPMDVINNEPVNNEPLVPQNAPPPPPPPKAYAQPPIPPKYRTGKKESSVRVGTVNPTKAPRIIRAPANVVTIAPPKVIPENPPKEETPKAPSRPPGLGITRPDKKKRVSPKNGNNDKPITKGKCCLLCRRRFKSLEMLTKHLKESALHRQNLKKRAEEQGLPVLEMKAPKDDGGTEGSIFRAYA